MTGDASTTACLSPKILRRHPLDIASQGNADQDVFLSNQIFFAECLMRFGSNAGAPVIAVLFGDLFQIGFDQGQDLPRRSQQLFQVSNAF